jgi:hypothetical protein
MDVSRHRPFLPGTSLEPAVIPTPQASRLLLFMCMEDLLQSHWYRTQITTREVFA